MPRIRVIPPAEAQGELAAHYEAAVRRAGRVYNVVSIQSLVPGQLDASLHLYRALMLEPGPLPRAIREMIATAVSREMGCFY